ncbi:claudin-23 [Microcaecilia unicolor]|uniref:Claudin-23 n=1 Tax=Microcaecilia unicolor TaxID=1415580 RepID=A0A6P7X7C1_9AMPH|nr:claudin-23 [Microcaecilia unicolor]
MRTPAVMIVGMVLGPCGLLLNLVATLAPNWREVRAMAGAPADAVQHQGIWDICRELESTRVRECGIQMSDYFRSQVVQVARGLMVASLVVTVLGLVVASLGVRCWQDVPRYGLAGTGGLVLFVSGVLSLIPISWYTHLIYTLQAPGTDIQVGYCLVLGYLASCFEIIGGFSLALSFAESYQKYMDNRKKYPPPSRSLGSLDLGYGNSGHHWPTATGGRPHIDSVALADKRDPRYHSSGQLNTAHSSHNPNWQAAAGGRNANHSRGTGRTAQSCYNNPADVTADERPARPRSQQSSLPCDSDLL